MNQLLVVEDDASTRQYHETPYILRSSDGIITIEVEPIKQINLRGGIASQSSLAASVTYTFQPMFEETPLLQLTMVPEPGTWALMLAGLGMVGWLGTRRKA